MSPTAERTVEQAIKVMYGHLDEPLTIGGMAAAAGFSRYHFSRIFIQVTGIAPVCFLSALRLQEAKRLLLLTQWSVAQIGSQVGYSSTGTFSTRFKESVGVAPTAFRSNHGFAAEPLSSGPGNGRSRIEGTVTGPGGEQVKPIVVGLFSEPMPRRVPVRSTTLDGGGPYLLDQVPPGAWYVMAYTAAAGRSSTAAVPTPPGPDPGLLVGSNGPIEVPREPRTHRADITLRPRRLTDPPVLLAPPASTGTGRVPGSPAR